MGKPWGQMDDQEKTRWLAEHIMGWKWLTSLEDYYSRYTTPKALAGATMVWWHEPFRCATMVTSEGQRMWMPLANGNDAWMLLRLAEKNLALFNRVARTLFPEYYQAFGPGLMLSTVLAWTPAQICQAFYEAHDAQEKEEASHVVVERKKCE